MKKTFNGLVKRGKWAQGTKAAHTAIVIETARHGDLKLRSPGGNPFHAPEFEPFVGKEISVTGEIVGKTLFVEDVRRDVRVSVQKPEAEPEPPPPPPLAAPRRPSRKYRL